MRSLGLVSGLLGVSLSALVVGAEPNPELERALGLVGQALQAEIDGDLLGRERLLTESEQAAPESGPANWFAGRVLDADGKWTTIEEAMDQAKANKKLDEYEAMRSQLPASVQGNWQAARWCAQQGMAAQCRAHLENIIVLDHDHAAARQVLGHQLVGNDWLTPQDQQQLVQRGEFSRAGFAKYRAQIFELMVQAVQGKATARQKALDALNAIDDPQAIPVMEAAAEQFGGQAAIIVAQWLGRIDHQEAALSLARLAVSAPDEQVHQAAIESLKHKSLYDFVPDLMHALSSPVMFATVPVMNAQGSLTGFRQFFSREGADDVRQLKFDTSTFTQAVAVTRPIATPWRRTREHIAHDPSQPFGFRNTWLHSNSRGLVTPEMEAFYQDKLVAAALCEAVMKASVIASVQQRQALAAFENQQISQLNERIARVISEVSQQEFVNIPTDVWNWWDRYNKTDYQKSKVQRQRYQHARFAIPRFYDYEVDSPYKDRRDVSITKASCFVAGTQVATLRGPRSIETIMPGDMVLSRHVPSGELRYQPVICGTQREPTQTVILTVDNDTIHATQSHLLWVSGQGWTQAGDIKPGDLLHAAAEPAVVMSTKLDAVLPTYNLIVMDTHTYFVGTSRVLSHDVLPRGSVHELVPGEFALAATAP